MAPPRPQLMEELVEEILLRIPPDDPVSLANATLVCKLWCQLICGAAFRRRFREFHHRAAPVLGLLYSDTCMVRPDDTARDPYRTENYVHILRVPIAYFLPTTSFSPVHAAASRYSWRAIDARHGRVLLCRKDRRFRDSHGDLCVWDPITDKQQDLPELPFSLQIAAVACAGTAGGDCDHLDCHQGHFLVVVMGNLYDGMHLSVYSSDAGAWSKVTVFEGPNTNSHDMMYNNLPGVLVGSALYVMVHWDHHEVIATYKMTVNHEIVQYDLVTRQLSTIRLPSKFRQWIRSIVLTTDDEGGLGFVVNVKNKLQLWSKVAGADGDAGFVVTRVIDLWKALPSGALMKKKTQPQVNGFADGGDTRILFIRTSHGQVYSIEINSSQVKKIANCCGDHDVIPYISFCTPTSTVQVQECN